MYLCFIEKIFAAFNGDHITLMWDNGFNKVEYKYMLLTWGVANC